MPAYRIYFVGPHGRFVDVEEVEQPDDAAVLAYGESLLGRHAHLEIWEQGRFVATLRAQTEEAPAAARMMPDQNPGGMFKAAMGMTSNLFFPPPLAPRV